MLICKLDIWTAALVSSHWILCKVQQKRVSESKWIAKVPQQLLYLRALLVICDNKQCSQFGVWDSCFILSWFIREMNEWVREVQKWISSGSSVDKKNLPFEWIVNSTALTRPPSLVPFLPSRLSARFSHICHVGIPPLQPVPVPIPRRLSAKVFK